MKKGIVLVFWILLVILIFMIGLTATMKDVDSKGGHQKTSRVTLCTFMALLACLVAYDIAEDKGKKEAKGEALERIPPGRYKKILVQKEYAEEDECKHWYFFRLMNKDTEKRICCFIPKTRIVNEEAAIIPELEIPDHFEVIARRHQDEEADFKTLSEEIYIIKPIVEDK